MFGRKFSKELVETSHVQFQDLSVIDMISIRKADAYAKNSVAEQKIVLSQYSLA